MHIFTHQRIATDGLSTVSAFTGARQQVFLLEDGMLTPDHPCMPPGEYEVRLRPAGGQWEKFLNIFGELVRPGLPHILVPKRKWILCHPGNNIDDTFGCPLPGMSVVDPRHSASRHWEVARSRDAFKKIYPDIRDAVLGGGARWRVLPIGSAMA